MGALMKVCVVATGYPEVSETFVARHVCHFDADVICQRRNPALPEDYYGPVRLFAPPQEEEGMSRLGKLPGWSYARWVANALLAPRRNFTWHRGMERFWRRYLDTHRPDVILAEFAPNAMSALSECRQRRIPLVVHFHGYDASTLMQYSSYRRALRQLFGQAAAVVCVSSYMRNVLLRAGCPPEKLYTIPCGAPVEDFTPSNRVAEQPCRFLAVSRLIAGKGPLVALEAFRRVHAQRPDVHFTYAGDGPLRQEVRTFVAHHGLREAVSLVGAVSNATVRQLMRESSVFVQASLTDSNGWVEGWGVSLAEALATALPAVVTRSGGMVDLVKDGHNGFLFEEGDSQGMAEKMSRLADDPQLRVAMGLSGRQHVEHVGSARKNLHLLAAVLRNACGRTRPRE